MTAMLQLASKTVLITGGARGIGLELARMCARDRATVLIADASAEHLAHALELLQKDGADVRGFVHDVTDRSACYALQRRIAAELGPVHVLINNAGIVHQGDFLHADDEGWRRTVDVNLNGVMWMMRAFMPEMIARKEGHVVNVASVLGLAAAGGAAVYCATKHALVGLTEAVRFELVERGCTGVSLTLACPGFTDTGMFHGVKTPPFFRPAATRDTALAIYRALRRRARLLIYPYRFRLVAQVYALTPHWLWAIMTRLLGVHRAMDVHQASGREGGTR
jgi:NAD(P)-dependent dehydrogenase (short-subunit alcohol dehydrogenase family)